MIVITIKVVSIINIDQVYNIYLSDWFYYAYVLQIYVKDLCGTMPTTERMPSTTTTIPPPTTRK